MENLNNERCIPLKDYEGLYNITSNGDLYSLYKNKNKLMSSRVDSTGYLRLTLSKNGKETKFSVHRLIALSFIPNPENKPCVNHINAIKTDNRIENLEWCSYKENLIHAQNLGLMNYQKVQGENHFRSSLKNKDVIDIKAKIKKGVKNCDIAKEYNILSSTVSKIKTGARWLSIN